LKFPSSFGLCLLCFLASCTRHIVRANFGTPPSVGTNCSAESLSPSSGQGSLSGVVSDATGAMIPQANVSTCAQGVLRATKTGADGTFTLNGLPYGTYSVVVSSPGFAVARINDLTVNPSASASTRITLKVGSTSSPVTVSSTNTPEPTPELPSFPVNPPFASSRAQLPPFPTMQTHSPQSLGEYDHAISSALEQYGYVTKGYFYYPGGFALATRIEQIKPDGESLNPPDRFSKLPPAPKAFSFDYLRHIFIPRTGYFRIIVFIITNQTIQESNEPTTADVAEGWPDHGVPGLPSRIAKTFASPDETVNAYIYEFENTTSGNVSDLTLLTESTIPPNVPLLNAEQHLRESHLWGALGLP
jgi:Carboxypeptidase regulatory-like domain